MNRQLSLLALVLVGMAFFFASCPGSSQGGGTPLGLDGWYKPTPADAGGGDAAVDVGGDTWVARPCGTDDDCEGGWFCDPVTNTCVECYEHAQCHQGICVDNQCQQLIPCGDGQQCPDGTVCDPELGVCVECIQDSDCPQGYECSKYTCQPEQPCAEDSDCPDGMICNPHTLVCVECLSDADCPLEEWCMVDDGVCLKDLCAPGAKVCVSGGVKICKDNGGGYGETLPCPEGTMCKDGECVPFEVCMPGTSHCVTEVSYNLCNDDGTEWLTKECDPGFTCKEDEVGHAVCVQECVPVCDGIEKNFCGPDLSGCGLCDECMPGYECPEGAAGLPPGTFVPCGGVCSCEGKQCGSDGCGGWCGDCEPGFVCQAGQCIYLGLTCQQAWDCVVSCDALPLEACADGCLAATMPEAQGTLKELLECIQMFCGGQLVPGCLQEAAMGACQKQFDLCMTCLPDCFGKECGDDGCGGDCGACPAGFACSDGKCVGQGQCGEILDCIVNSQAPPDVSVPMCMSQSSPDAQALFLKFADCVQQTCGDFQPDSECYFMAMVGACADSYKNCVECTPACIGKECGSDGCGGWCGFCQPGSDCDSGKCVCIPNCGGKECGPDGCGNLCGVCDDGFSCTDGGKCYCKPDCVNKECGGDGCGGMCGFCPPAGYECTKNGSCVPLTCKAGQMECDGNTPLICGPDGTWISLGLCPEGTFCSGGSCVPWVCLPGETKCEGNGFIECADNGAGWLPVELCPAGSECKGGKCVPTAGCGDIPKVGCCTGTTFFVCTDGAVSASECGDLGCGWIENWGYGCGGSGEDPNGKFPLACPGCNPVCEGKECGSDGCGGTCGECQPGSICTDGICEPLCLPDCKGKVCGEDGCGGVCGLCAPNQVCQAGKCVVPPTCKTMLDCALGCWTLGDACFGTCSQGADEATYKKFKDTWACATAACMAVSDPTCFKNALTGKCYQQYLVCVSCAPACAGTKCGPDGCGGACGACAAGEECVQGACKPVCIPVCNGLECGDNGCGGQCGLCKPGYECQDGKCVYQCVKQCAGKECGPDGCGDVCGYCPPGLVCADYGLCIPEAFCGDGYCDAEAGENQQNCPKDCGQTTTGCDPTPFAGCGGCKCEACVCQMDPYCCQVGWDTICVEECKQCGGCCAPQCTGKECGPDGCGGQCGTCSADKKCNAAGKCEVVCVPDCAGKQCGPDDCGGTCGTCPVNQTCLNDVCFAGKSCSQLVDCSVGCVQQSGAECLFDCLDQGTPEAQTKFFDLLQCVMWQCGMNMDLDCMLKSMKGACLAEYNACIQCKTDCVNKQCGPNGCGGNCGVCQTGYYCDNYKCKPQCTPSCTGKECGDNGCGGSCGVCKTDMQCSDTGKCVPVCKPNCTGKQCGADGCGGLCGSCPAGMVCSPEGLCQPVGPVCGDGVCSGQGESCLSCQEDCGPCTGDCCQSHDSVGCSDPAVTKCVCSMDSFCCEVMWDSLCADEAQNQCGAKCGCVPSCAGKQCGPDGCNGTCGTCPAGMTCQSGVCKTVCTPNCVGKQCGTDGCGGTCGKCADGFKCDTGKCVPSCVPSCTGKKCGPDGCSGICGLCGPDQVCLSGQCQDAWDCELLLNCLWDCAEGDETCTGGCWSKASPEAQEQYLVIWECILEVCGPEPVEPCPGQAILTGECKDEFNACLDCTPTCTGKQCGSDGCGGDCGACPTGYTCSVYGYCNCVPSCTGKVCGNDGCGGSCGECSTGYQCNLSGKCVCLPQCTGKQCGPDGCGGSCGLCPVGQVCDPTGKCVAGCVPNCVSADGTIKQCGPDGCGGQCGYCPPGLTCTAAGQCQQTGPVCGDGQCDAYGGEYCLTCPTDCGPCTGDCCTAHDGTGCADPAVTKCVCSMDPFCCQTTWDSICASEAQQQCGAKCGCIPSCTGKQCGSDGCGGSCGTCKSNEWCDQTGKCIVVCTPQCTGKKCGPDGCGGTCGTCPAGQQCNASGQCVCVPNCLNKACGPDGCGGSCGTCGQWQTCTPSGQCKIVTPLCGDGNCQAFLQEDCDSCPADCGKCCGNGVCEGKFLETCSTCPSDCGKCCGNGFCDVSYGETCSTCALDCGACPPVCGDAKCEQDKGETCTNCSADCGTCPDTCGDGLCSTQESCVTCSADCGPCEQSCCLPGQDPGCSNLTVQKCVCAMDSYCCDVAWDSICAGEADQCGSCNGNCCLADSTPGCDDETIEQCVCAKDPYCCNVKWDASCAADVTSMGCGKCGTVPVCGDGMCDATSGETCTTCPKDCGICPCVPNCTGKQCGSDGCGGSCGTCPEGQTCSAQGTCSGTAGLTCAQILQCSTKCTDLTCFMSCYNQGTAQSKQIYWTLMGCVMAECGMPPSQQCMLMAFMGTCNQDYQKCAAN